MKVLKVRGCGASHKQLGSSLKHEGRAGRGDTNRQGLKKQAEQPLVCNEAVVLRV